MMIMNRENDMKILKLVGGKCQKIMEGKGKVDVKVKLKVGVVGKEMVRCLTSKNFNTV